MGKCVDSVAVDAFHRFSGYHCIDNRLFYRVDRCAKQSVDLLVWQHAQLRQATRLTHLGIRR